MKYTDKGDPPKSKYASMIKLSSHLILDQISQVEKNVGFPELKKKTNICKQQILCKYCATFPFS